MGPTRGSVEWECNRRPRSEGKIWNYGQGWYHYVSCERYPRAEFLERREEDRGARGGPIAEIDRHSKEHSEEQKYDDAIPRTGATFRKRRDKPTCVQILITASKAYWAMTNILRAGLLVSCTQHETSFQRKRQRRRPGRPLPPYEMPEALIYQPGEPSVAAASNASRERGRVTAKFSMKDDEYSWRQSSNASTAIMTHLMRRSPYSQ